MSLPSTTPVVRPAVPAPSRGGWLRFDLVRRWPPDPAHPDAPGREHDVIKWFNRRRKRGFQQLLEEEHTYREVIATVASLGSSIESSRTGRLALVVAAMSLTVAATLLVTPRPLPGLALLLE